MKYINGVLKLLSHQAVHVRILPFIDKSLYSTFHLSLIIYKLFTFALNNIIQRFRFDFNFLPPNRLLSMIRDESVIKNKID